MPTLFTRVSSIFVLLAGSTFASGQAIDTDPVQVLARHSITATPIDDGWELRFLKADPSVTAAGIEQLALLRPREESAAAVAGGPAVLCTPNLAPGLVVVEIGILSDAHLAGLARYPELREIRLLLNSQVTDAGLAHLKAARGLAALEIELCPNITRAGVAHIGGMTGITRLSLGTFLLPHPAFEFIAGRGGLVGAGAQAVRQAETECLDAVARLPRLERLSLPGFGLRDAQLARLVACRGLKELSLAGNPSLTPAGMAVLAELPALQSLDLTSCRLESADLAFLERCPRLTRLSLRSTRVTDAGLSHLAALKPLRHLDLAFTEIDGTGFGHIAGLGAIESLDLTGTKISGTGFEHLGKLTRLQSLGLRLLPDYDGTGLDHLSTCAMLTRLDLSQTRVGDHGLARVGMLRQLRELHLPAYGTPVRPLVGDPPRPPFMLKDTGTLTDVGLASLGALVNLEELTVGGKEVTDKGLVALAKLTRLRKLTLGSIPKATGSGLVALKEVDTLTELDLSDSDLPDAAMKSLPPLASVRVLWLPKTATDAAIPPIKEMTGLRRVYHWGRVTPVGADALRDALPRAEIRGKSG